MEHCHTCKRTVDEPIRYKAFDLQRGYEQVNFCSAQCLKEWVAKKKIGMWCAILLGVAIAVLLALEGDGLAIPALFLPYTIRQSIRRLNGLGEFMSFALILLSAITVVYPAYKFIQELNQYRRLSKQYL